jgi:hypothetical protein
MFEIKVVNESGYEQAVDGIGLSYGVIDKERLKKVAFNLVDKDGGHNKFLESMVVWIEIKATRCWWQEFDTYRIGTTKQSESTIHTITKRPLTPEDFDNDVSCIFADYLNTMIYEYNNTEDSDHERKKKLFKKIKVNLPEGYLQKRLVCTNYKTLRNMIWQRRNHRLKEWHTFIDGLKQQLKHSEILFKGFPKEDSK